MIPSLFRGIRLGVSCRNARLLFEPEFDYGNSLEWCSLCEDNVFRESTVHFYSYNMAVFSTQEIVLTTQF